MMAQKQLRESHNNSPQMTSKEVSRQGTEMEVEAPTKSQVTEFGVGESWAEGDRHRRRREVVLERNVDFEDTSMDASS